MKYEATITVLWAVSWPVNEYKNGPEIFFEEKAEAEQIAAIPLGWYSSTGNIVVKKFIDGDNLPPSMYPSAKDWADDNLTVSQARKYGFLK